MASIGRNVAADDRDDVTSPSDSAERRIPFAIRLLSGVGGVLVFLLGLVLSLGAAIAAPLGMFLVHRWTIRHNRRPSRIASLVGAVLTSSAAAAALWLILFVLMPRPSQHEMETAVTNAQQRPHVKLPDWYTRVFPQAARADSTTRLATQQLMQSRAFRTAMVVLGAVFVGVFFGVLGGTVGWLGSTLMAVAWSGSRAP